MLELLASGPASVEEIAAQLPVSRPAVSQHLKRLLNAGLVDLESQGRRNVYSVATGGVVMLREYADRLWDRGLARFKHLADSGELTVKTKGATTPKENKHD